MTPPLDLPRRLDVKRRLVVSSMLLLALPARSAGSSEADRFESDMRAIEQSSGGRLGVSARLLGQRSVASYRGRERFPLCSTFKVLAAALILERVDRGEESLARSVSFGPGDLVVNSPVTSGYAAIGSMSLGDLCKAAITRSDNTAGNLMLRSFGGTQPLTAFARSLGDATTRLDRVEPLLNEATPGDPRDTTSPLAMGNTLDGILAGDRLSSAARSQLVRWLLANETGDRRLRSSLPTGWRVGDKTGSGDHGTANDVGLLWPPGGASPLLVCCYLTQTNASVEVQNATIAAVGLRCSEQRW